ncbi:MAG: hypothetical protein C4523_05440 [Myxococcales bacterium]|nr:MAG: hypothetical protein C4523_05440 [Myxococcales bacterium]
MRALDKLLDIPPLIVCDQGDDQPDEGLVRADGGAGHADHKIRVAFLHGGIGELDLRVHIPLRRIPLERDELECARRDFHIVGVRHRRRKPGRIEPMRRGNGESHISFIADDERVDYGLLVEQMLAEVDLGLRCGKPGIGRFQLNVMVLLQVDVAVGGRVFLVSILLGLR